ncbi:MAG: hypothetical protein AAGJ19_15590 [Myxococcota bacterium]
MMNISMKNILQVLPALALAGTVACGDDENNNGTSGNGNGNGNGNMTMPSFQQQALDGGQLRAVSNDGFALDPDTLAVSVTASPSIPLPGQFDSADYFGAVDPDAAEAFWQGWVPVDSRFDGNLPGDEFHPLEAEIMAGDITGADTNACATLNADFQDGGSVTVFGEDFPVCVVSGRLTESVTLPNNHVFVLDGSVNVGDGETDADPTVNPVLTISAGTQVYAAESASGSALRITRGAEIDVQGNRAQPVIFAAVAFDGTSITGDPTDLSGRGDWGGVILQGEGVTNDGVDVASEAAPPENPPLFGGTDNADDSGSIVYAIIAETGFAFQEGSEVQGLTVEAAGSGTNLDWIAIIGSNDDCVEFFGGAASISHLVCVGVNDDALDLDLGYVGSIQFALIRIGDSNGERGIESDSNSTFDALPRSAPVISNITVLGNPGRMDASSQGALHREGIEPQVWRSVFTDDTANGGAFENGCIDIDNTLEPGLVHEEVVYNCSGGEGNGLASADDN